METDKGWHTGLFDRNGTEIKIGDTIEILKVGHPSFKAKVYYGQGSVREDTFGRCLWDYTLAKLGENKVNCYIRND